jgi:hypothetical protein
VEENEMIAKRNVAKEAAKGVAASAKHRQKWRNGGGGSVTLISGGKRSNSGSRKMAAAALAAKSRRGARQAAAPPAGVRYPYQRHISGKIMKDKLSK